MARVFHPAESYSAPQAGYHLLPFRFLRLEQGKELLVNEVGEFVIAPNGTAHTLIRKQLARGSDLYSIFRAKQFITDDSSSPLLDLLATKYRTKHNFIDGSTKLHIFVVTLRCDHSCSYCQVSRQTADKESYDMSLDTAEKSIGLMMGSPAHHLTLELQGGEPLLAFDLIRQIVPLAKRRAESLGKEIDIVVTTNLANATDDMLYYLRDENIKISTSLDGPAFIHNANRPRPGNNSYELTIQNIERARKILGFGRVSALMTTTWSPGESCEGRLELQSCARGTENTSYDAARFRPNSNEYDLLRHFSGWAWNQTELREILWISADVAQGRQSASDVSTAKRPPSTPEADICRCDR